MIEVIHKIINDESNLCETEKTKEFNEEKRISLEEAKILFDNFFLECYRYEDELNKYY
jgi:hypothetical protein